MSTSDPSEEAVGAALCRTPDRMPPPFHAHYELRTTSSAPVPPSTLIHPGFLPLLAQTCTRIVNPYLPNPLSSILHQIRPLKSGCLAPSILIYSSVPQWPWKRLSGRSKRKLRNLESMMTSCSCALLPLIKGKSP